MCLCWEAEGVGAIVPVLGQSVPCSAVPCCAVDGGALWTASLHDV
jgi:hypothetical protein